MEKVKLLDTYRYYSVRKQVNNLQLNYQLVVNVKAHECLERDSPSPCFFGDKYPKL